MAKFRVTIGYSESRKTSLDVYEEVIVERDAYCEMLRNVRKSETSEHLNDDITLNNQLSIVADPYAFAHFFAMKYAEWMGVKWKITNVEVQSPRLILTIGGVYNESSGWA